PEGNPKVFVLIASSDSRASLNVLSLDVASSHLTEEAKHDLPKPIEEYDDYHFFRFQSVFALYLTEIPESGKQQLCIVDLESGEECLTAKDFHRRSSMDELIYHVSS